MEDETRLPGAGAYEWDSVLKQDQPAPKGFENPAGLSTDACDIGEADSTEEPCEPGEVEDMVLGETMPGQGIPGYDAEEDGGG